MSEGGETGNDVQQNQTTDVIQLCGDLSRKKTGTENSGQPQNLKH